MTYSMDLSVTACQAQFRWERWNCPKIDFVSKQVNPTFDRESAFVQAITIATLIYTVTRNCAKYNEINECLRCFDLHKEDSIFCSESMNKVIGKNVFGTSNQLDVQGWAEAHNNRAALVVCSF